MIKCGYFFLLLQPLHKRQKLDKPNGIVEDENKLKSLATTGKEWKEVRHKLSLKSNIYLIIRHLQTGVHPSWAAKQLQKTQLSITTTAAPQGKKIVFDED